MKFRIIFIFLLLLTPSLFAAEGGVAAKTASGSGQGAPEGDQKQDKQDTQDKKEERDSTADALFTGTLLAFYPTNAEPGQFDVLSTVYITRIKGFYDSNSKISTRLNAHTYSMLLAFGTGITKNIDITLDLFVSYAHTSRGEAFSYGDTIAYLGFQIARDEKDSWVPDIRVVVGETFPTGKYQGLDPDLDFADATGGGSYGTFVVLIVRKIYYFCPKHPFNWNLNLGYFHASEAHVKGLNVFGGDPTTRGFVSPSQGIFTNLAFEYKFNKPWGCGLDINFIYQNSASFHGKTIELFAGSASSYLLSLAPMIEYNVNEKLGWDIGLWFSVAGRNDFAFFSGLFSIYYIF